MKVPHQSKSSTIGRAVLSLKLVGGGARFNLWSRLSTSPFGVFLGFLQNSRKYGLGSLRKKPTDCIPLAGPGPTSEQLAFSLQPNPK